MNACVFPGYAYRMCDITGSWALLEDWNKTWSNYSECWGFLHHDYEEERVSGKHGATKAGNVRGNLCRAHRDAVNLH